MVENCSNEALNIEIVDQAVISKHGLQKLHHYLQRILRSLAAIDFYQISYWVKGDWGHTGAMDRS
jgi:hypothetical protein